MDGSLLKPFDHQGTLKKIEKLCASFLNDFQLFKKSLRYDIDICKVNNLNSRIEKPLKEKKFALLTFVNRSIIYGYYQYVEMNNINRTDRSVFELL